jgi:hypothetical protein
MFSLMRELLQFARKRRETFEIVHDLPGALYGAGNTEPSGAEGRS